jgi:hypothetical protein
LPLSAPRPAARRPPGWVLRRRRATELACARHGSNLGDDVAYGTVGASFEAATLGVPALCFSRLPAGGSLDVMDPAAGREPVPPDFTAQARLAAKLVGSLSPVPPGGAVVLNINFPDVLRDDRLELTRLGRRWYPAAAITPLLIPLTGGGHGRERAGAAGFTDRIGRLLPLSGTSGR